MRSYADKHGLKASVTDYRQYGSKKRKLRFSKSNNPYLEKTYSTHYVDKKKTQELKFVGREYAVKSNKELGHGRPDIILKDTDNGNYHRSKEIR